MSAVLRPGETAAYGYWVLRLEEAGPDLELWEHAAEGSELQRGAELAMRYRREQLATCERAGARYDPPLADRLVVVTDGVFEGDPAEGVRYPSARRPDLARFLALPFGFRFPGADARLDPEVAGRPVRG